MSLDPQPPVTPLAPATPSPDHRCLYGHRVPARLAFAIQSRQCPVCGAPSISISGYQAARRLAEELQIDALVAFNSVRLLEQSYRLVPIEAPVAAVPPGAPSPVVAEIEVSEDDFDLGEPTPADAPNLRGAPSAADTIPSTFGA